MHQKNYLTLLGLLAVLWQTSAWAQVQPVNTGYTFAATAGTYTPITGGTVITATPGQTADDNVFGPFNIGFPFYYSNVTTPYTQFSLNANGFIGFGGTVVTSSYTAMSGTSNNIVVALNRDLQADAAAATSDIRYEVLGTAPNRVCVVQWSNYKRYGTTGTGDNFNFQVILYETSNIVQVVYGNNVLGATNTASNTFQVGLRGSSNAVFNNLGIAAPGSTAWATPPAGTANADVMQMNATGVPASGQTYTWTPACLGGTNIAGTLGLSSTSACAQTASVTLTSSGYTGIVTFQASTDGGLTWTSTAPNNQTVNTTDVTQTLSLTATTDFRAAVSCGGTTTFTAPQTFTLAAPAATSITPSVVGQFCNPPSATLDLTATSGAGYTFTWEDASTNAVRNLSNVTTTTTYSVTATDGTCTATANYTVSVTDVPSVTASANPTTVCQYGTTQVSAVGAASILRITELTLFRTGTGATSPYPAYSPAADDDFVEISNLSNFDLNAGGIILDVWTGTTLNRSWTIPANTIIPANSVLVVHIGTGTDSPANRYFHSSNGGTGAVTNNPWGPATALGVLIRNGSTILDAVATNSYAWPGASNVTAADWTGTIASSSGRAGVIRSAATDTNVAANWVLSNTPSPLQTIGALNPGLVSLQYGFLWSTGQTTANFSDAPATVGTSTYDVTVTDIVSGCTTTSSVSVTVTPASPDPTVTPNTHCGTAPSNVSATSGAIVGTFTWYDAATGGNVLQTDIGVTTSTYTAVTSVTTDFWVEFLETGSTCPSQRIQVTETVTAPAATSITPSVVGTFCNPPGATLDLTATSGVGYTFVWEDASTNAVRNLSNVTTTTTYSVTATDGTCTATANYTVTVDQAPIITAAANPDPICSGDTSTLTVTVIGGGGGGGAAPSGYCAANATSTADDDIASVSFGAYTRNSPGWPGTTTNNAGSVGQYNDGSNLAAAPFTVSGVYAPGTTYTLSVTQFNSGATFYGCYYVAYFDWNRDGDFADAGEVVDLGSTTFGDAVNNVRTANVTVPITATPGTTRMRIVQRESGSLATTLACGTLTWGEVEDYHIVVSANVYSWAVTSTTGGVMDGGLPTGADIPAIANLSIDVVPVASGSSGTATYTVTVTDPATGCTNSASVVLNVTQPSASPAVTGSNQCGDNPANVQADSGVTAGTFTWYDAATGGTVLQTDNNTTVSILATPTSATTTYWVSFVETGSTCPSPRVSVTATIIPSTSISVSGPTGALCSGGTTTTLTASSANLNYSYAWNTGDLTASISVTPAATTTYTVTATDGPCTATASFTVVVAAPPSVTASSNPSTICSGSDVALMASASSGPGAAYCTANATSTFDDDIASVSFGSFTNNSTGWPGATTSNPGSNATYTDYTAFSAGTYLPGNTYTLSVTQFNSGTTFYGCYHVAYFDWNQDGDFADLDETVDLGSTTFGDAVNNVRTASVTVPMTAVPGKTRMRIVQEESATLATTLACGTLSWGEVEDYSIYISYEPQYSWSVSATTGDAVGNLPGNAGTPSAANANITATPTAATGGTVTYEVLTTDPGTGCTGTSSVTVTVNAAAMSPSANPTFQCGQGQATLVATSTILSGTFNWYDTPAAITPINTETTSAGISIYTTALITTTTTFYVEFVEPGNPCPSARIPVVANVVPSEVITITTNPAVPNFCSSEPDTIRLVASSNDPGYIFTWSPATALYLDSLLTQPYDGTGNQDTLYAAPNTTTTYNVSGTSGICSGVSSVTITVTPSPVAVATATPNSLCGSGTSALSAAPPSPSYCTANATSTADDDIASVSLGSFTNNSTGWPGATTSNASATATYTDYTALTPTVYQTGNTYTLSVTQFNSGATFYGCYHVAYFDWNQDGDFADVDETVDLGSTTFGDAVNNVRTASVTVPSNALAGRTRMRIVQRESGTLASTAACGTLTWGEVEDYTIIVNFEPEYAWTITGTTGDAVGTLPPTAGTPSAANANVASTNAATAGGTVTYLVTVSDPLSGCTSTAQTVVSVFPVPTSPSVSDATYCGSALRDIVATSTAGSGIFMWYDQANTLVHTEGTVLAPVSTSTYNSLISATSTFTVTYTENGCTSSPATVTITVTSAAAISVSSLPAIAACSTSGTAYTLTASSTDPDYTYTWQYGSSSFTGNPLVFTPTATIDVTVTGTNALTGCSEIDIYTVAVTPAPSGTATAVPSAVCSGSEVELSLQLPGGSVSVTDYCTANATSTADDDIASVSLGSFTNNSAGWPGATTNNASANATYTNYTALNAGNYIPGNTYTLSVTQFNSGTFFYGCYHVAYFDWNSDNDFADAGEAVDLGSTTGGNPAANVRTANVTVPLTATPGPTLMRIVQRESGSLATTLACGTLTWGEVEDYTIMINPYNYSWTATTAGGVTSDGLPSGAGTPSPTNFELAANPTATTAGTVDYVVTISDVATGCTNSSVVTVNVNPLPAPPSVPNPTICGTGTPTLTTADVAAPGGIFTWYDAATGGNVLQTDGTTAVPVINSSYTTPVITTSTSYWVTYTDANGCTSSARQVDVTVTTADAVSIAPTGSTTQCSAETSSVVLTASSVNTNYTYTWSDGQTGASITVNPAATTTYTVTATDGICSDVASLTITINASPAVTAAASDNSLCLGESTVLSLTLNGGNVVIPAPGTPTYCAATSGGSAGDFIANVTLGSINNTTVATGAPTYYNDFTAQSTTLASGGTYTISLQVGTWGSNNYIGAWIDYNNNGSFDDAGEQIALSGSLSGSAVFTNTFTVPTIGGTGAVRMRVREVYFATSTPCNNPTPAGFGETEDYTINLTGAAYTFVWSNGATTTNQTVTPPLGTNNYTVTVTSNGCSGTAATTVTVNPIPNAQISPASAVISCANPTATLTASGGDTYVWSDGSTNAALTTTAPGTYSVTVSSTAGCSATASATVTGSVNPPGANAGPDRTLTCTTPSVNLTATSGGASVSYSWSDGVSIVGSTATISVTTAGTYTVTVTDTVNGCTSTDSAVVTSNQAAPNLSVSPTSAVLTCTTTSATLTAASTTPGASFVWSDGTSAASTTVSAPGTYTVTVTTSLNGCTSTASVVVSQDITPPTANAGNDATFTCVTSALLGTAAIAGNTYAWSPSAGLSAANVAQPTTSTAGTYTVTVTGTNGCTASDAVNVIGNTTPPTPTVSGTTDICAGTDISLTATGGTTYSWSGPGGSGTGATLTINNATVAMSGTYTVTATGSNGCTATASIVVTVTQCCIAEAGVLTASNTLCPGDPIVASASGQTIDPDYAFYYLLVDNTGTIIASNTTGTFAGVTPGSYTVYGYSVKVSAPVGGPNPPANGTLITALTGTCLDLSNATSVNVPQPFPPFVGNVSISQGSAGGGGPFAYNVQVITLSGGTLPYNFDWDNTGYVRYDIQYTADGAIVTISYTDNATWACTVTDSNNCGASTLSFTNVPGPTTNPVLDIDSYVVTPQSATSVNGAIDITVSGGGCTAGQYTYQWSGPNGFTATTEDISGLATGWYDVTVTCPGTGQTTIGWYWVPKQRRGRNKVDEMSALSVSPNPFESAAQVEFVVAESGTTHVALYSVDGKQVTELYHEQAEADKVYVLPLDGGNLAAGVYIVKLTTASGSVQTARVVVAK